MDVSQRIDAFELWCWRRLLRVLWTARRSNQSTLKESNPEYSLEGLMLKLKLQSFGHLMGKAGSLDKTLMLRKSEGRRRKGWQRIRWLASLTQWIWMWANSGRWWRTGKPGMLQSRGCKESDMTLCYPMDCSPPGCSVHGISQARILVWVAVSSSRGSSRSRHWTHVFFIPHFGRKILYHCTTGKPYWINRKPINQKIAVLYKTLGDCCKAWVRWCWRILSFLEKPA